MTGRSKPDVVVQNSSLQSRPRIHASNSFRDQAKNKHHTPNPGAAAFSTTALVQLVRFSDGRLELFDARIGDVGYIAISHVWGQAKWLRIDGVEREVYASPQKAEFIKSQLPGLVGSTPFWMDTLTVDQRDKAQVISVVQIIPTIFRRAEKTLAVRENDCFYECCLQCIDNSDSWGDIRPKIMHHAKNKHYGDSYSESFLLRLWTLQECLFSHTIQFVKCKRLDINESSAVHHHRNAAKALDALYILAHSFAGSSSHDSGTSVELFVQAFLKCSTISRSMPIRRGAAEDVFSDKFVWHNRASDRSASEARDYIFAIMTQFPWYHYPRDAENMTFSAIYIDLHSQAAKANHAFTSRLTRSMTESLTEGGDDIWLPSSQTPEPTTLGDFLKLLGQPLQADHSQDDYHMITIVNVVTLDQYSISDTLKLIKETMRFQPDIWRDSYLCGELSKYGVNPETADKINMLCREVSELTNLFAKMETIVERHRAAAEYRAQLFTLLRARATDEWIFQQAMKILSLMWCATDKKTVDEELRGDWKTVQYEIIKGDIEWSTQLQSFLLLLAAMLSCQIPLSAFTWARHRFTPVCVEYRSTRVLAIVANHALPSLELHATRKRHMISVGRHTTGRSFGMDLVLADPSTNMPVGLLPDFLYVNRTNEEIVDRMEELYHGIYFDLPTPQCIEFARAPLRKIRVLHRTVMNCSTGVESKSVLIVDQESGSCYYCREYRD